MRSAAYILRNNGFFAFGKAREEGDYSRAFRRTPWVTDRNGYSYREFRSVQIWDPGPDLTRVCSALWESALRGGAGILRPSLGEVKDNKVTVVQNWKGNRSASTCWLHATCIH